MPTAALAAAPPAQITSPPKRAMLAALAKTGNITIAAQSAKISRRIHYDWLRDDLDYAEAAASAMDAAGDLLEEAARKRAVDGVEEPVYQGGVKVGTVQRYSDSLLMCLLKGAKPDKYRERSEVKHSGAVTARIKLDRLPDDKLDELERLLDAATDTPTGTTAEH